MKKQTNDYGDKKRFDFIVTRLDGTKYHCWTTAYNLKFAIEQINSSTQVGSKFEVLHE